MMLPGRLEPRHVFVGLAILLVTAVLLLANWPQRDQELYVALFGRVQKGSYPAIHRHALEHYLKGLSRETPGYRFVLKPSYIDVDNVDDDEEAGRLKSMYEKIVDDDDYVMVIDNTWAKHVQAVDRLVREEELPVLFLNADTGGLDFGGYGIFMNHSDLAATDLVTYMNEVLRPATVGFIGEDDYWLTEKFHNLTEPTARHENSPILRIDHKMTVETESPSLSEKRTVESELNTWFKNADQPAVLLLNVHNDWGLHIIDYVEKHLENVTILAASYASREGKSEDFSSGTRGNRLILMTEPEDAVSNRVGQDLALFRKQHPGDFEEKFNIPFYVKRCLDATEIMREALLHATKEAERTEETQEAEETQKAEETQETTRDPREEREQSADNVDAKSLAIQRTLFASYFKNELIDRSIPGRYDLYIFDEKSRRIPEVSFVEYDDGVATSQWRQLNSERKIIPTVFFGIDLLDIGRVDPDNGRFHADFYYWIQLQPAEQPTASGASPAAAQANSEAEEEDTGLSINKHIHFRNLSQVTSRTTIEDDPEGTYRLERISGDFNIDFQLEDYPLDRQELTLELELTNPADKVRVAFDLPAFEQGRSHVKNLNIAGWKVVDYSVTVDNVVSKVLRGATPGASQQAKKYKTLTVRILIQRKVQSALISIALPLCAISIAALSLLFIRKTRFDMVGDVYIGVFLSVITYSIAFAQITPATGVITRADWLLYLTFLVVLLVFLRFVILNVLDSKSSPRVVGIIQSRSINYVAVICYVAAVCYFIVR